MKRLAVIHHRAQDWLPALREAAPGLDIRGGRPTELEDFDAEWLAKAEGLFCWKVPPGLASRMPSLAWVQAGPPSSSRRTWFSCSNRGMSFGRTLLSSLALAASLAAPARAEDRPIFPQLSPQATVAQVVGTTTVEVTYHRPAVRNRAIWGTLVPYGQVWGTGANEATTIRFSDPVQVNGQKVPAGTYALFAIPAADRWTLILNRRARQLGAWEYDPKQDVLRFDVKPKTPVPHTEWLTYEVYPAGHGTAYVDLYWEKLRVSFLVEVDVDELVTARMRKAMRERPNDWKLLSDAAQYCAEQEIHMGEALGWADRSIKLNENPSNLFVKARLFYVTNRKAEANQLAERALQIARQRRQGPTVTGPIEQILAQWKRNGGSR